MGTVSTSIRFDEELLKRGKEEADFEGISFNALITGLLAERLQDIEDYHDAAQSIKESENKPTISKEEMMRRYG